MKIFLNIKNNTTKNTRLMLKSTIIFSLSAILCSAFSYFFAEYSNHYYDMIILSFDLITALRSSFAILVIGTVLMAYLEKKTKS